MNQLKKTSIEAKGAVPEFKVTQSSSIRRAVRGLTVIVAAYSIGTPLFTLCHTF